MKKCLLLNYHSLPERSGLRAGWNQEAIHSTQPSATHALDVQQVRYGVGCRVKNGCDRADVVDLGIKVNGQYYRNALMSQQMTPAIKHVAGDTFVFQQDSAPVHRARDTIQLRLTSLVLTPGRPTVQT